MNNKQKELRRLTWKHFWKQKREEIGEHFKEYWGLWLTIQIIALGAIGFILTVSIATESAINYP